MEPADHHHLSTHDRQEHDDIDNTQAVPDDHPHFLVNQFRDYLLHVRSLVDQLLRADFECDNRFNYDAIIGLAIYELGLLHVDCGCRHVSRAAIIDGERQPENDPRIGDDRGVVE